MDGGLLIARESRGLLLSDESLDIGLRLELWGKSLGKGVVRGNDESVCTNRRFLGGVVCRQSSC